jgi:octaprenyl-diphosphate synthase
MPVRKTYRLVNTGDAAAMQELFAPAAEQIAEVRCRLAERLTTPYSDINQRIQFVGAGQGKLFRPVLLLLSGQATGSLRDVHHDLAVMIELIHTATLLHDDVIDQAGMRRNRQTINSRWSNTTAVLLGDFLFSRAFLTGSEMNISGVDGILSRTAEKICQGELLQNIRQGDWTINEKEYIEIIEAKTASLFAAGCRLGALASSANVAAQEAVEQFGCNIGLAFQITDDILDIAGDDSKVGKTLGTDFIQRKLTLPIIHYLYCKKIGQREKAFEQLARLDRAQLIRTLKRGGSLEYARSAAQTCSKRAVNAISHLKPSPAKDAMKNIAVAIAARA